MMTSYIMIDGKTVNGVFEQRLTRFSAQVKIQSRTFLSFLPNPGRLDELLTRGAKVILKEVLDGKRKTSYDLIGVHHKGQRISLDSRVPNKLVLEALRNGDLPEFTGYDSIKPEHLYGVSRFDFLLSNGHEPCLLEVKSCTLAKSSVALFPDARTKRGTRQLRQLIRAKHEGYRGCVLFIVQRTNAYLFSPNDEADAEFGSVLRHAARKGIDVYAYCSEFVKDRILLKGKIRVDL